MVGVASMLWGAVAMAQLPDRNTAGLDQPTDGAIYPQPTNVGFLFVNSVEPAEYWLGIGCAPVPSALRAQLNLPEKQGLLVGAVVLDSPAAKAGIVPDDILLRAGDKPLAAPRDLVRAIAAAKQGKLKIDLLRGGKPKTVEATPAKRPEELRGRVAAAPRLADWETMEKWLREMGSGGEADGPRPPMRFRFFHPGAIVPPNVAVPPPLPQNMSVVISKEGDQPAKIVVKRGDQKWEVTEKELDKLPADVRPHVERMFGRGLWGVVGAIPPPDFGPETAPSGNKPQPPDSGAGAAMLYGPNAFERMEKRFDEMNRRMDKLFQEVEQLHENHAHPQAPEKPAQP